MAVLMGLPVVSLEVYIFGHKERMASSLGTLLNSRRSYDNLGSDGTVPIRFDIVVSSTADTKLMGQVFDHSPKQSDHIHHEDEALRPDFWLDTELTDPIPIPQKPQYGKRGAMHRKQADRP